MKRLKTGIVYYYSPHLEIDGKLTKNGFDGRIWSHDQTTGMSSLMIGVTPRVYTIGTKELNIEDYLKKSR